MLNPLRWKPEHRGALFGASGVGAVLGVLFAYTYAGAGSISYFLTLNPIDTLLWAAMGAILVGGTVYAWRLFSS
jgi:hypothetical protein